jgi:NMD protein affecting ribosome stability and mRNA decay
MMRCAICGAPIKPWFEVCYECYNPVSKNNGKIPEPIKANHFMKEMKIDRW